MGSYIVHGNSLSSSGYSLMLLPFDKYFQDCVLNILYPVIENYFR